MTIRVTCVVAPQLLFIAMSVMTYTFGVRFTVFTLSVPLFPPTHVMLTLPAGIGGADIALTILHDNPTGRVNV